MMLTKPHKCFLEQRVVLLEYECIVDIIQKLKNKKAFPREFFFRVQRGKMYCRKNKCQQINQAGC